MAGRTNYRVKLDLSKYYHDARRFSWIYVNSTNIWFISHLKRHIKDIFDIAEPFHLLLNGNEYLPPAEDVRVLEENEIIVVERGSGLGDGGTNGGTSTMSLPVSDMENGFVKSSTATDKTDPCARERKPLDGELIFNGSAVGVADVTRYHSMLDVTGNESGSDGKRNDDASVDSSILEPYNVPQSHKRKRTRRKKTKHSEERQQSPVLGGGEIRRDNTRHEKPKVVGSYALPSGTHIRFDNADDVEDKRNSRSDDPRSESGPNHASFKSPRAEGLTRLLSLGNCSSPIAFANKRAKYENGSSMEQSSAAAGGVDDPSNGQEHDEYADLKPQEYPSLENTTEVGDVIAFKVLRIGSEYTPEVSDYVVAKTLARCPENNSYTFKILKGRSEIEDPSGKFSLPDNEAHIAECDTAEFNFSQLIEPRLIGRTQVSR